MVALPEPTKSPTHRAAAHTSSALSATARVRRLTRDVRFDSVVLPRFCAPTESSRLLVVHSVSTRTIRGARHCFPGGYRGNGHANTKGAGLPAPFVLETTVATVATAATTSG